METADGKPVKWRSVGDEPQDPLETDEEGAGAQPFNQSQDLRYTIAAWLYEMEGVPERQISEMLGHTSQSALARTSMIYAQYRPEKMGKVVRGMERIWRDVSRRARAFGTCKVLASGAGRAGDTTNIIPKNPAIEGFSWWARQGLNL